MDAGYNAGKLIDSYIHLTYYRIHSKTWDRLYS